MYRNPAALFLSTLLFATVAVSPCHAAPFQEPSAAALTLAAIAAPQLPPAIVIGFLGGRVKKNNAIHREVQIAMRLRQSHPTGLYAQVFQNSHGRQAFREIERQLDVDRDGSLSPAEKQRARIILYGHSWGASQTVTLARQLEDAGIPVLLTVLVDRVVKIGAGDPRIPANVAEAVNFYQLDGLLHGRSVIRAEDPARTRILGNYRLDYKNTHVDCSQFPWYARAFMGPHIEIENDPRVWNRVTSLIDAKLAPEKTSPTVALIDPSR